MWRASKRGASVLASDYNRGVKQKFEPPIVQLWLNFPQDLLSTSAQLVCRMDYNPDSDDLRVSVSTSDGPELSTQSVWYS